MKYEVPSFEMIKLNNVDIITTSLPSIEEQPEGNTGDTGALPVAGN